MIIAENEDQSAGRKNPMSVQNHLQMTHRNDSCARCMMALRGTAEIDVLPRYLKNEMNYLHTEQPTVPECECC